MQAASDNLKVFISEQKAYFELTVAPIVEFNWDGLGYNNENLNNRWIAESQYPSGLFSCDRRIYLNFKTITIRRMKGLYLPEDRKILPKTLEVNKEFQDFTKALLLNKYYKNNTSIRTLRNSIFLLVRLIYVRLFINGDNSPKVININSKVIKQAMDALALESKDAGRIQANMSSLIKTINRLGVTLTPLTYKPTVSIQRRTGQTPLSKIDANKNFHDIEFTNELDDDENRKLITIQTFLNIVAARSMVKTDGEKIMLNLTMILIVTGLRFGEAFTLRKGALKRLKIEDKDVVQALIKKGLMTYYLGIEYAGEKGAGQRVHWVEPLAIPLVETIYDDTIKLTQSLRYIYVNYRKTGVGNFLHKKLKNHNVIELNDIITYVSCSVSSTNNTDRNVQTRLRQNVQRNLKRFGLTPFKRKRGEFLYYKSDVIKYLESVAKKSANINNTDFSLNFIDTATGEVINIPYEDLLFIAPLGSLTTGNKLHYPTIASPIPLSSISHFLKSESRMPSLFETYGLVEEDGEFSSITTHMPRHNINTFLAIAGINDHLQAAMMGRVDITQNETYQHLALEERAKSSSLVPYEQSQSVSIDEKYESTELSPTDTVSKTGILAVNPELNLHNGLNQNFHTFTTHEDTEDFFEDMINSDIDDITAGLRAAYELEPSKSEKKELLRCHADLHPLDLGSCMRKVELWSCPYNHKCQDGKPCPYFTLTGRSDEPAKLEAKIKTNIRNIKELQELALQSVITPLELTELTEDLNLVALHLERLSRLSTSLEFPKQPINLVAFDDHKQPKTLATIFAYEHRKLEKQNSKREDNND